MKISIFHNSYIIKGGEDSVVESEKALLLSNNANLSFYIFESDLIKGFYQKLSVLINVIFSKKYYKFIKENIAKGGEEVVHVHNFFPVLTPSVFYACKEGNIPSVLTLHNYRTVCPTALLMFRGQVCERSLIDSAFWAVPYKAYRNSYLATLLLASMIEYHKYKKTWQLNVDRFICLTNFSRNKFIQAGFPADKIVVKPNFCEDPGYDEYSVRSKHCTYIGRLSQEKGIDILLTAWKIVNFPLLVLGEGEISSSVPSEVYLQGRKSKSDVFATIKTTQFVVVPSICYEGFPMAIVEAFACGTPVICSKLGSMEEIVTDGVTGLHFEAGNSKDLAEKVQWMVDNPAKAREMGRNARNEYLQKYTPERNYEMLMDIYQQAIDEAKKGNRHE